MAALAYYFEDVLTPDYQALKALATVLGVQIKPAGRGVGLAGGIYVLLPTWRQHAVSGELDDYDQYILAAAVRYRQMYPVRNYFLAYAPDGGSRIGDIKAITGFGTTVVRRLSALFFACRTCPGDLTESDMDRIRSCGLITRVCRLLHDLKPGMLPEPALESTVRDFYEEMRIANRRSVVPSFGAVWTEADTQTARTYFERILKENEA